MSDDNSIIVWDRESEPGLFNLRRTLRLVPVSSANIRTLIKARGRYSVFIGVKHVSEMLGLTMACVQDDDELRAVLRSVFENCAARGINDVAVSTSSSAVASIINEERERLNKSTVR